MQAHFTRRDIPAAAETYLTLLRDSPEMTLSEEYQLDVANQLLADGRGTEAARAYERFLQAYPRSQRADDVRLLLASVYARTLGDSVRARPLLEALRARLRDPARLAFTETLLSELAT